MCSKLTPNASHTTLDINQQIQDLVDAVCAAVRPGDAVTVKGSLSMKMALVVKALKERYGASATAHALKG